MHVYSCMSTHCMNQEFNCSFMTLTCHSTLPFCTQGDTEFVPYVSMLFHFVHWICTLCVSNIFPFCTHIGSYQHSSILYYLCGWHWNCTLYLCTLNLYLVIIHFVPYSGTHPTTCHSPTLCEETHDKWKPMHLKWWQIRKLSLT